MEFRHLRGLVAYQFERHAISLEFVDHRHNLLEKIGVIQIGIVPKNATPVMHSSNSTWRTKKHARARAVVREPAIDLGENRPNHALPYNNTNGRNNKLLNFHT